MGIPFFDNFIKKNRNAEFKFEDIENNSFIYFDCNSLIYEMKDDLFKNIDTYINNNNEDSINQFELNYIYLDGNFFNTLKGYLIRLKNDEDFSEEDKKEFTNIIKNTIKISIIKFLQNYLIDSFNEKAINLNIVFDGICSAAKMIEQRRRKYIKLFEIYLKEKLLKKESYEYIFDNLNIFPKSEFMLNLEEAIQNEFSNKINIFSSNEEFEGEQKIFKQIKDLNNNKDVYIISNDSDIYLWSLINNKTNTNVINYIKEPNPDFNYIYKFRNVEISNLKKFLIDEINKTNNNLQNLSNFDYEEDKYEEEESEINKENIDVEQALISQDNNQKNINDIVFIFFIFGNDYIPNIESFNIQIDTSQIIDLYKQISIENKDFRIIEVNSNSQYVLNLKNFIYYLILYNEKYNEKDALISSYLVKNVHMNTDQTNKYLNQKNKIERQMIKALEINTKNYDRNDNDGRSDIIRNINDFIVSESNNEYKIEIVEYGGGGDCLYKVISSQLNNEIITNNNISELVKQYNIDKFDFQTIRKIASKQFIESENFIELFYGMLEATKVSIAAGDSQLGTWDPLEILKESRNEGIIYENDDYEDQQLENLFLGQDNYMRSTNTEQDKNLKNYINTFFKNYNIDNIKNMVEIEMNKTGNNHWGSYIDMDLLSDAFNIGFIIFRNQRPFIYCNTLRNQYQHYMLIYSTSNIHFQGAKLIKINTNKSNSIFKCNDLPKWLIASYNNICKESQIKCIDDDDDGFQSQNKRNRKKDGPNSSESGRNSSESESWRGRSGRGRSGRGRGRGRGRSGRGPESNFKRGGAGKIFTTKNDQIHLSRFDEIFKNLKIEKYNKKYLDHFLNKMYAEPKYKFHKNLYDNDYPIVKLIEGMKPREFKKVYNKKYFANTGMDNVVKDYFYGIYWLFQNYFNQDYEFNKFWFYKYEKAPLLSTIIEKKWHVVDKVEDNCEIKETLLNEYRVEQSNNFDFDEHLLFIIPNLEYQGYKYTMNEDVLSRLTEKMAKIDLDFYPDLKLSVDELDDKINKKSIDQNVIDCTNAPYFSKCYLKILNEKKKTDANTFLKKINVNVEYNDEEYDDDVYGGGAKKDKEKYFSKYIKYKSKYLNLKNNKK